MATEQERVCLAARRLLERLLLSAPLEGISVKQQMGWLLLLADPLADRGDYAAAERVREVADSYLSADEQKSIEAEWVTEGTDQLPREVLAGEEALLAPFLLEEKVFMAWRQRYLFDAVKPLYSLWRMSTAVESWTTGKRLRLLVAKEGFVRWSADSWLHQIDTPFEKMIEGVYFADLPLEELAEGQAVEFTFFWQEAQQWQGNNFRLVAENALA